MANNFKEDLREGYVLTGTVATAGTPVIVRTIPGRTIIPCKPIVATNSCWVTSYAAGYFYVDSTTSSTDFTAHCREIQEI